MPQQITFQNPSNGKLIEITAWSEHDLTEMAQITDSDQQTAASYWRRYLPRRFRTLLDAVSTIRRV